MAYSTNRLLDQFYMSALHPSFTQDDGDRRRDDDGHHYYNNNSMPPAASRSSHSAAAALLYAGEGGSNNDAHANRPQLYGQSYSISSSLPRSNHHQPHAQYRNNEQQDDERGRGAWGRHGSEGPNNNSARRHRRRSSLAMSGGDDEGHSLDDEDDDGVEGGEQPTSLLTEYRGNRHQEQDDRSYRQRQQAMSGGGRPDSHTSSNNNNNNRFHHRPPQQQQHQQRTTAAAVELPTAAAADYGAAVSDEVFALEAQLQRRREAEAARDCSPEEAAQSAFYLKNKRWKDAVQQRNERLKRELDETAEQELRFTPTVNQHPHPHHHRSPGRTASGGTGSMMTTTTRRQASGSPTYRSAAAPGWYHRNANDDNDYDYDYDEVEENEYDRHHQHHQDPLEVVDRLLQYQQSAKEKHEALRRAKAKEELKGCTFRPRTVKNALSETIQPRYLDAPPSGSDRNSARRKRAADGNDDDHLTPSFHPVVNPWVPGGGGEGSGSKMEGYLSLPVHERLHKEAQSLAERRDRVEKLRTATTSGRRKKSPSSSSVARSRSEGGPGGIQYTQTASVYDPMTSAHWGDETALSPLGASTEGGDSPTVGRRVVLRGPLTVARAPTTDGRGSTTTPNRSRRPHDGGQPSQQQQQEQAIRDKLAAYEEERQKRFQELEKSVREGLTFQPSICRGPKKLSVAPAVSSSVSAAAAAASVSPPRTSPRITKMAKETRRSLQDLQSFQHLTETKVQRLREERLREEDELMTDRPFITKYAAHAQGKVLPGTTGSIEDYRRFVAMEQRVRQRDLEAAMEAKESQAAAELQECTFHPTIHDAPSFVRDIAKEIRKVDGGVAARKRREAAKVVPPRRETVPW